MENHEKKISFFFQKTLKMPFLYTKCYSTPALGSQPVATTISATKAISRVKFFQGLDSHQADKTNALLAKWRMERKKKKAKIILVQGSGHHELESAEAICWVDCPVLSPLFFALYFCLKPKIMNVSEK